MNNPITIREIFAGFLGAITSGIIVWLISEKFESEAKLSAIENLTPQINSITASSAKAEVHAAEAMIRATESLEQVKKAEKEAKKIIENINLTPLFLKVDESLDELKAEARNVASQVTMEQLASTSEPIQHVIKKGEFWNNTQTNVVGHVCTKGQFLSGVQLFMTAENGVRTPTQMYFYCSSVGK